jgi:hypothetical protein
MSNSHADHRVKLQACYAGLLKMPQDNRTLHKHKMISSNRVHSSSCKKVEGSGASSQVNSAKQALPQQQQSGSSNSVIANRQTARPACAQLIFSLLTESVVQNITVQQAWQRVEEEQNDAEPADAQMQSSATAGNQPDDDNDEEEEEQAVEDAQHQLLSYNPPSATGFITGIIGNVQWMAECRKGGKKTMPVGIVEENPKDGMYWTSL